MKKISLFKKTDAVIIAVLLALGLAGAFLPRFFSKSITAEIYFDGTAVKEVPLSKDTSFMLNDIKFEVKNNAVCVVSSTCRDKICVHTGFISSPAQVIVCVPNKLVVKVVSKNNAVDLIVG